MLEIDARLEHVLGIAYGYLNRRERTRAQVRGRLEREQLPSAKIDAALEVLIEQGLVDDVRYARLFTEDKRELDGWGSDRIRRTLLERGIDRQLIEETLGAAQAQASESELDRAVALLKRRFPEPPRDRRERDRALGMMLRKGYDSELALDALRTLARSAEGSPEH